MITKQDYVHTHVEEDGNCTAIHLWVGSPIETLTFNRRVSKYIKIKFIGYCSGVIPVIGDIHLRFFQKMKNTNMQKRK